MTELGERVLPEFTKAFDRLGDAVQSLRSLATPDRVNIAALPAITQFRLSPRLPAIRSQAKDYTVSVTALEKPPNLEREQFDLSFFLPSGKE